MIDRWAPQRHPRPPLPVRVTEAAEDLLERQHYVSVVDILCAIQLLEPRHVELWKKGIYDSLEERMQGFPKKVGNAIRTLHDWARGKGLGPSEAPYVRAGRGGPVELRFTLDGNPELERMYRTHFLSPSLPEQKRTVIEERQKRAPDPVVFQAVKEGSCSECGVEIDRGDLLSMEANQPLCMQCAGFGDLEFLAAGDTALTRRTSKYTERKAIVVRFNRSRGRYERQGILAEPEAIARAEAECSGDADERAAARKKAAGARAREDEQLTVRMAEAIRQLFPRIPAGQADRIARHTAVRGSGRVGRSAAGRTLRDEALTAAVRAAVRHHHTNYDELLASGVDREAARRAVGDRVLDLLKRWSASG